MATRSAEAAAGPPAGILLAAGASTRMGHPKALVEIRGRPAIQICLTALTEGGCQPVVVVLGADAERIRTAISFPKEIRIVVHEGWASGRTGSLKAGLRAVPDSPACVIWPVDHPLATARDVSLLAGAFRESRPPVVRPVREGRGGHPILLSAELLREVLALGDDEPLRTVVRAHREREVTVPGSSGTIVNVDTPEDLEGVKGDAGRHPPPE